MLTIIILIIVILMNSQWLSLVLLSPLLRVLSYRRLHTKQNTNCNKPVVKPRKISLITNLKLYLASYHTRLAIKCIGNIPSHRIRNLFYSLIYLVRMGEHVVIYYNAELRSPWNLEIGQGTIIGDNVILDASRGIKFGRNVNVSSRASFYSLQHDYRDQYFNCTKHNSGKIEIGDRVWIGPQVIVLPNVTIGEGSVVAGGAVVTKNIPPFEVWGGIPAKKIGDRPKNINYIFDGYHPHFL